MLNQVPKAVNSSSRLVTLRHPNSQDAQLYRKTVTRVPDSTPASVNDLPTIGGLGVLDSEDEASFEYTDLGECRVMFTGQYAAAEGNWNIDNTGLAGYPENQPCEALVECVLNITDPAFFTPQKHDLVMVMAGAGFVLAYEVVGVTGTVNIPPYVRKYHLQPRNDLNVGV